MKLLNAHVENFGKLSNFNYAFKDGLNVIYEANGFGKTTFASFIKAMLYGFPKTSSQNINLNERKKYIPWNGENFGGYLEFEINNKSYRVTRFFGKTSSKDTFELYDLTSRKESNDYSEKLGEEVFGIDVDSFSRSTYLPQNKANGLYSTTSIQTKLSNLVEDTNDLNNYDLAIESLKQKRSEYKKYKGNNDLISNVNEKIVQTENKLYEINSYRNDLKNKEIKLASLNNQIEKIKTELKESRDNLYSYSNQKVIKEKYSDIESHCIDIQNKLNVLEEKYPNGIPNDEELNELKKYINNKNVTYDLDKLKKDIELVQDEYNQMNEKYLSDKDMHTCFEIIRDYNYRKSYLDKTQQRKSKVLKIVIIVWALFTTILVLSNLFLHLFKKLLYPILVMCIIELICIFLYFQFHKQEEQEDKKREKYWNIVSQEKTQLDDFFSYYDSTYKTNSYLEMYNHLFNKEKMYSNEHYENIQNILNAYGIITSKESLKEDLNKLLDFVPKNDLSQTNIKLFEEKYDVTYSTNLYEEILKDINTKQYLVNELEKYMQQRKNLTDKYSLELNSNLDLSVINEKENKLDIQKNLLEEDKNNLITEINSLQNLIEEERELSNTLFLLKENKKIYEKKCNLLDKTINYLTLSKEKLASRYIEKVEINFKNNIKELLENEIGNILLDVNLNIQIEEYGQNKTIDSYSTGLSDCIDFCMRLALVDALFEKENPFLILDDPFADFDDVHLDKILKLIQKISINKQILYFACHKSRLVNVQ